MFFAIVVVAVCKKYCVVLMVLLISVGFHTSFIDVYIHSRFFEVQSYQTNWQVGGLAGNKYGMYSPG